MTSRITKYHQPDYQFIFAAFCIIVFGLIMLSSAGVALAYKQFSDSYYFLKHQIAYGLVPGIFLFYFFFRIDYKIWKKFVFPILICSIILLILVLIPGLGSTHGTFAQSWLSIGGLSFQPSEFIKLTFLLYLAAWFEKKNHSVKDFKDGLLPFITLLSTVLFLIYLQSDIGTMMIILIISFVVYFIAGADFKHLVFITVIGTVLMFGLIKLKPYRMARFMTFLHPELDPQGVGYHINQALLAIGSGGIFGKGYGHSRQKFLYLPEPVGDSIFAIISEEMGMFIGVILIGSFIYLMHKGFEIGKKAPDDFGKYIAIGITAWFTTQMLINISGMIGLLPMTGITLPFVSYGGTAFMASMAALGIMVNISRQTKI